MSINGYKVTVSIDVSIDVSVNVSLFHLLYIYNEVLGPLAMRRVIILFIFLVFRSIIRNPASNPLSCSENRNQTLASRA